MKSEERQVQAAKEGMVPFVKEPKKTRYQILYRLSPRAWDVAVQRAISLGLTVAQLAKATLYRDLGMYLEPQPDRRRRLQDPESRRGRVTFRISSAAFQALLAVSALFRFKSEAQYAKAVFYRSLGLPDEPIDWRRKNARARKAKLHVLKQPARRRRLKVSQSHSLA